MLDDWTLHGRRELTQGTHEIMLEYFDAGGDAVAKLDYERTADAPPSPPPTEPFAE